MHLRTLLASLPDASAEGRLDRTIRGLAYDPRRVQPGMAFVALRRPGPDEPDRITEAVARGASAIICEQGGFVTSRVTRVRVADTQIALPLAAAAFHQRPADKLRLVLVTGDAARLGVAFLVRDVLRRAGWNPGLLTSVGCEIGERLIPQTRGGGEALELQQWLAAMVRGGCQTAVLEVTPDMLERRQLTGMKCATALVVGTPAWSHGGGTTFTDALPAEHWLVAQTMDRSASGEPADPDLDPAAAWAGRGGVELLLRRGREPAVPWRATHLELTPCGTSFRAHTPEGTFDCQLPRAGRAVVAQALVALAAAPLLGVSASAVRGALATASCVPGQLERVGEGRPRAVFVDGARTAAELREALRSLRELARGRLGVVCGAAAGRAVADRRALGRAAAEGADATWLTADNPGTESPALIAAAMKAGHREVRPDGCAVELDRRQAIEQAVRWARPGDAVLIAGKGHETFQEEQGTVVPFDDRACAREALAPWAASPWAA